MRKQIKELVKLGPLPSSNENLELIKTYEEILNSIIPPVTIEEAKELLKLFGPDDCYGLAWTLLHLIETSPIFSIEDSLQSKNEWIELLKIRIENKRNE